MIALWMAYATVIGVVLAVGASVVERMASGLRQRRWIAAFALVLSATIPAWAALSARAPAAPVLPNVEASGGGRGASTPSAPLARVSDRIAELIARADGRSLRRLDRSLTIGWALMALLAFGGYGVATWLLARRRRTWRRAEIDGQPVLLAPLMGPAVIGTLRPEIVVPEWSLALSAEQRALMLEHERQHVRANDPLVLHAAAMIALLMPWNAAAWWLNRRLRLAVELDCDARVLARGHDAREYGTLLLDVCARRPGSGLLLAPALFERTSSLTRRILAMHPQRPRFPRARLALGTAVALAVTILACEMPSPEAIAPDGKNVASKRLYGDMQKKVLEQRTALPEQTLTELRQTVSRYFPSVARGEGGPSILFVVKSSTGVVVMTETQAAAFARTPAPTGSVENSLSETGASASRERVPQSAMKTRRPGANLLIPAGVGALRPDDIATVDVTKHAASAIAPNAVSVIAIVLKPGAQVPTVTQKR